MRLQSNVMIRIERIPVERILEATVRKKARDRKSAIRRLLHMNGYAAADGRIRGKHHVCGANLALLGCDLYAPFLFDGTLYDGVCKQLAAAFHDRARQSADIFEWMNARLIGKAQRAHTVAGMQWRGFAHIVHRHPGPWACRKLIIELRCRRLRRQKEIPIEAPEIAVDILVCGNCLDAADCRRLALIDNFSDFDAARLDQL